jgi:hypothetical protein
MFLGFFKNFKFFMKIKSLDAPKSILETEKTLKTPSFGQIYKKKKTKKKKNPLG